MTSVQPSGSKIGRLSAAERLARYNATTGSKSIAKERERTEEEQYMAKLFSIRSAHLPGNNWCQDWIQWMKNNHPLLGLCCRHPLNPIGIRPRLVLLMSSISFGLVATNLVYLFYGYYDADGISMKLDWFEDDENTFVITYKMISLWTIGGLLHSLVDLGMWHLTACACCLPGSGCHRRCGCLGKVGPYVAVLVAALLSAAATFVILMRASYEEGRSDSEWTTDVEDVESFVFLFSYLWELSMVYLCWHPFLATVFFSGAIWGVFPCIGGRPKEIKRQQDEAKRMQTMSTRTEQFDDDDLVL